jgi:pimeloyl-ACP methyl ester carboxylesterase
MAPITFVHGAGLSSECWQYQTEHFGDSHAVDLPGHGDSAEPLLDSVAKYAEWLGQSIRSQGPDPVALAGHSMGSLIALETAARNPDMVSGLVLIATSSEMRVHRDLLTAAREKDPSAAAMVIKWSLPQHGGHGRAKDWVLRMSEGFMDSVASGAMGNDLAACDNYNDALAMAAKVRCPTLLLLGENDMMTKPSAAQPLAAAISDARIVVIEKVGHMLPLEKPDEVNEAISLFLTIA